MQTMRSPTIYGHAFVVVVWLKAVIARYGKIRLGFDKMIKAVNDSSEWKG